MCSGGGDGIIKLWDSASFERAETLVGHRGGVMALAADHCQFLLFSGSTDGTVRVWDLQLGACKRTIVAPGGGDVLALASTSRVLVFGEGDGAVSIVCRRTWEVCYGLNPEPPTQNSPQYNIMHTSQIRGPRPCIVPAGVPHPLWYRGPCPLS